MALKHAIPQLTDVAEALRGLYEAGQDGKFYLQVEGMVPSAKLDEFRTNNINLQNKVNEFETKFKDVDVVKYRELLAAAGKTPQEIEDAVQARVKKMSDDHTAVVTELQTTLQTTRQTLNTVLVDGTLKSEAAKAGVLATAIDDVVLRGRTVYQTVDGKLVAKNEQGQPIYDRDGTTPLQVATWLKDLKKTAPHLFEGMKGGGGQGNGGGQGGIDLSKATTVQKIAEGLKSL